jgi:threonine dehydrogenase-like Zn-dependent dehydrogenase
LPIGAIAFAKAAGASKIIVFEPRARRAELARQVGADNVFDAIELRKKGVEPLQKTLELTGGKSVDMHVESAGDPSDVMPQAERSSAIGGKIVQIGRADLAAPVFFDFVVLQSFVFRVP